MPPSLWLGSPSFLPLPSCFNQANPSHPAEFSSGNISARGLPRPHPSGPGAQPLLPWPLVHLPPSGLSESPSLSPCPPLHLFTNSGLQRPLPTGPLAQCLPQALPVRSSRIVCGTNKHKQTGADAASLTPGRVHSHTSQSSGGVKSGYVSWEHPHPV